MSDIIAPGTLLDEQKDIVSLTTGSHPLYVAPKQHIFNTLSPTKSNVDVDIFGQDNPLTHFEHPFTHKVQRRRRYFWSGQPSNTF